MSKFKFSWQIPTYFEGKIVSTKIQIVSDDSSNVINVAVPKDCSNNSDIELVNLALEQFYQETYPNRAENEKFAEIDKVIQDGRDTIKKIKNESETTQAVVMNLLNQLAAKGELAPMATTPSKELEKENDKQTKETMEGGENNDGNVIRN